MYVLGTTKSILISSSVIKATWHTAFLHGLKLVTRLQKWAIYLSTSSRNLLELKLKLAHDITLPKQVGAVFASFGFRENKF